MTVTDVVKSTFRHTASALHFQRAACLGGYRSISRYAIAIDGLGDALDDPNNRETIVKTRKRIFKFVRSSRSSYNNRYLSSAVDDYRYWALSFSVLLYCEASRRPS
jgi:hypothetical protein